MTTALHTDAPADARHTANDPVCGMAVDRRTALSSTVACRTYYFRKVVRNTHRRRPSTTACR